MKNSVAGFGLVIGLLVLVGLLAKFGFELRFGLNNLPPAEYQATTWGRAVVKGIDDIPLVTAVDLTADEWSMFATSLDGKVWAINNLNNAGYYEIDPEPIYSLNLGWEPGEENGMTGLAVSYDFILDKTIFVSYAKRVGSVGRNYIDRLVLDRDGDSWKVASARTIFTGNTTVLGAHQIQGLIALPVEDKLHVMFTIGDTYHPEYAHDLRREAGKVMMVQADGSNPLGVRPYPNYPRVQAVGIRNAYDLARNELTDWIYLTDNGPDVHDRILYAPLLNTADQYDFGWDGTNESMLKSYVNGEERNSLVLHDFGEVTVSPTSIDTDSLGRFFVSIFSTVRMPEKEILMGEIGNDQILKLTKIVQRREGVESGNLLGIAVSDLTGNIWFGDIQDGALYALGRSWELVRVLGR